MSETQPGAYTEPGGADEHRAVAALCAVKSCRKVPPGTRRGGQKHGTPTQSSASGCAGGHSAPLRWAPPGNRRRGKRGGARAQRSKRGQADQSPTSPAEPPNSSPTRRNPRRPRGQEPGPSRAEGAGQATRSRGPMPRPTLPSPRSSPRSNETSASPSPQTDGQQERFCNLSSRRCPSPLTGSIRRLVDTQAPTRRASREVVHSRSHDTRSGEAPRARSRPGNKDR